MGYIYILLFVLHHTHPLTQKTTLFLSLIIFFYFFIFNMTYKTTKEKVKDIVEKHILPHLYETDGGDLEYYELVSNIASELGTTNNQVESVLRSFISSGRIAEHRVLTIGKKGEDNWLDNLVKKKKQIKQEVDAILK